ncbi:MAG: hypothetical protein EOS60_34105 [Mesorhizobium sp.]|nr:MAG: hypothetical protein EOS60_34105 [Mesorhizobium sp.]
MPSDARLCRACSASVARTRYPLEARWASLAVYGVTAALLADVLPIDGTVNASTIRNDAMRVAERLEAKLGPEQAMFASGCQAEWNKMRIPGPPVTIGIDGGYVRSWTDRPTNSR